MTPSHRERSPPLRQHDDEDGDIHRPAGPWALNLQCRGRGQRPQRYRRRRPTRRASGFYCTASGLFGSSSPTSATRARARTAGSRRSTGSFISPAGSSTSGRGADDERDAHHRRDDRGPGLHLDDDRVLRPAEEGRRGEQGNALSTSARVLTGRRPKHVGRPRGHRHGRERRDVDDGLLDLRQQRALCRVTGQAATTIDWTFEVKTAPHHDELVSHAGHRLRRAVRDRGDVDTEIHVDCKRCRRSACGRDSDLHGRQTSTAPRSSRSRAEAASRSRMA